MKTIEFTRFEALDYNGTEGLNTLCTNLTFAGADIRKIMTTSCHSAEGKSFVSMNMMRSFAGLGKRVVLVDADLRRSMIMAKYGAHRTTEERLGLTHYLAGMCGMEDVLYATNIPGAYIVPVGRTVNNSLALLTSPKLGALLDWLATGFDFVLVDAPPVGMIIDAAEIAKSCDGALFVVNYNSVGRRELLEAVRQMQRTGVSVLGAVLNNVTFDSYSSKKYYYKSYYYSHYETDYYQSKSEGGSGRKKASKKKEKSVPADKG